MDEVAVAYTLFDRPEKIHMLRRPRHGEGVGTCCTGAPKQQLLQKNCCQKLASSIMPSTFKQDTPTASVTNLCPPPVRDPSKDTSPTWDKHMLQAISHYVADIGQAEGSYRLLQWTGVIYRSLWLILKGVKQAGAAPERTQEGSDVRKHSSVGQMHEVNWEEAVVNSQPYYRQRCALEAWHISTKHQTINRNECSCRQSSTP